MKPKRSQREYDSYYNKNGKTAQRVGPGTVSSSLEVINTTISTTATKIVTPSESDFTLDIISGNVYINDASVAANNESIYLEEGDMLVVANFKTNDENELYAITESGTAIIQATGGINE